MGLKNLVTYTYDATTGLLTQVTDNLTGTQVNFAYDNDFRLTTLTRSNGVNTTLTWDNAARLTRIQDGTFLDLQYTLDAAGQVTQLNMTAPLDPASLLIAGTESFSYDNASQLTTPGYSYDERGRLTALPGDTFTWDGASRLTGISGAGLSYNGLSDLVTRASGETIHYYYNYAIGLNPIMAEKNDTSGQFLRYYVWTPGGSLLYMIDAANGNQVYFYHFDRTGSTLALTDQSGTVTDSYAYDPYGRLLSHQGTNPQPFTFVGEWGVRQDPSTSSGLYHMRARYYDAQAGRFISRDPVWPDIGNPLSHNPYQYAENNPLSYIDPSGLGKLDPHPRTVLEDLELIRYAERAAELAFNQGNYEEWIFWRKKYLEAKEKLEELERQREEEQERLREEEQIAEQWWRRTVEREKAQREFEQQKFEREMAAKRLEYESGVTYGGQEAVLGTREMTWKAWLLAVTGGKQSAAWQMFLTGAAFDPEKTPQQIYFEWHGIK